MIQIQLAKYYLETVLLGVSGSCRSEWVSLLCKYFAHHYSLCSNSWRSLCFPPPLPYAPPAVNGEILLSSQSTNRRHLCMMPREVSFLRLSSGGFTIPAGYSSGKCSQLMHRSDDRRATLTISPPEVKHHFLYNIHRGFPSVYSLPCPHFISPSWKHW